MRVIFLTTNPDKHAEVAALLKREASAEVERRTATLAVPPSNVPAEVAEYRALQAFRAFRVPVFAEALGIDLGDGLVSGASYRQAFEPGSPWLEKNDGVRGTAFVAVGYTADGTTARVFETPIEGHLIAKPRGKGVAPWERHWVPAGGERTIAELGGENRAYRELANAIKG